MDIAPDIYGPTPLDQDYANAPAKFKEKYGGNWNYEPEGIETDVQCTIDGKKVVEAWEVIASDPQTKERLAWKWFERERYQVKRVLENTDSQKKDL